MALVVQKYGGSSVATAAQIQAVAKSIATLQKKGDNILVVVSAMGSTTDDLSRLAYSVSPAPKRRELDMLLSTGERVSSSLLAMALHDQGVNAISFTGSQAGILTDDSHTNAQLIELRPVRIEEELKKKTVVVLAGFQGVSPKTKEITTLGRGGSDLSAVALAIHFKSDRCEILKEVDGIFSADPKIEQKAHRISEMTFEALQEITFWGAKVIHHRAAELAATHKVPLFVGLATGGGNGTKIHEGVRVLEQKKVLSVNSHQRILKIQVTSNSQGEGYELFERFLNENGLPWPQILDSTHSEKGFVMITTAPVETLEAIEQLSSKVSEVNVIPGQLSSVTATCAGLIGSDLVSQLTQKLGREGIQPIHTLISPMSVTYVVNAGDRNKIIKSLHEMTA